MRKFIAITNVIAWAGFWAFGYLALMSPDFTQAQMTTAVILAALGFGVGMFTYIKLCNIFTPAKRAPKEDDI